MNKKLLPIYLILFAIFYGNVSADVINGSSESVYVKKENGSDVVEVKPGEIYKGEQDGVASRGEVTKSSDGVDLTVKGDGDIEIMQRNPITRGVENLRAGKLEKAPDGTWDSLFEKADDQSRKRAERERIEAEARARVEQERREAEARARAERQRKEAEERARAERERREAEARAEEERRERHRERVERDGFDRDYDPGQADRDAWESGSCRRC